MRNGRVEPPELQRGVLMSVPKVYLFWDNSNIFISAKSVAEQRERWGAKQEVRVHFTNLFKLAIASRPVGKAIAVGSIPPEHQDLWDRMKQDTGIEPELYERGSMTRTEQGLDQCLQTHMLRAAADEQNPQIAVLLTGDGAGYDVGSGFHADLKRMHENGWGIEVLSWDLSCKPQLRDWAKKVGVYVKLEDYYDVITFLEGERGVQSVNLTHRKRANVGLSKTAKIQQEMESRITDAETEAARQRAEVEKLHKELAKKKYLKTQERRHELAERRKRGKRR